MHEPAVYHIRVQGHLDQCWTAWFDGLVIRHDRDGTTVLSGVLADHAAVYGVLSKLRNLGLTLLTVRRVASSDHPVDGAQT
jgi:hypothetical protein